MTPRAPELSWREVCLRLALLAGVVATLTIVGPTVCLAVTQSYEGRPISGITFEPPTEILSKTDLEEKMARLKIGQPLRMADLRATIQDLYESGRFEDISVDAEPDASGGVRLRFITPPAEFIRNVVVSNVPEPPNQGQLVTATKLQLGVQFTQPDLKQSEENVMESLRSDGFYSATLNSAINRAPNQQVDVSIAVDPGD